jgi:cytochrome c oxidase assembly factor CtaG
MPHLHHGEMGSLQPAIWLDLTFAAIALVYLHGWLRLRSTTRNRIAARRAGSFFLGMFLIWIALASPLAGLDHQLLTAHMAEHLLLMTLAPPLIWLGAPVMALLHGLPQQLVYAMGPLFRWRPVQQLGSALGQPVFCWLAATATLVGWHIPAAFTLGINSSAWHMAEHVSFFVTGLLFWWPVIQPWPSVTRPDLSIIVYLFLATLPCDIIAGLLVFGERVVYTYYFSSMQPFGLSALEDQQCAGALMWTCVTVVYLVVGAILTTRLLSPQSSHEVNSVQTEWRGSVVVQGSSQSLGAFSHGD